VFGLNPLSSVSFADAGPNYWLAASSIISGAPSVASGTFNQTHILTTSNLYSGNPDVQICNMSERETFEGANITTGAPVIGLPAITQNHVLGGNNILAGVMTLDGLVRFVWEEQTVSAEIWTEAA
jgi:hypothetical protein